MILSNHKPINYRNLKRKEKDTPLVSSIERLHADIGIINGVAVVETSDNRFYVVTDGEVTRLVGLLEFGKNGLLNTEWED